MNATLLVELFTEELPPKALRHLGEAFKDRLFGRLVHFQLKTPDPAGVRAFATPRRLGVLIPGVLEKARDRQESRKLMPAKVAYGADGTPAPALIRKLEKEGGSIAQVERGNDGEAQYVFLNQRIPGLTLAAGLKLALEEAVASLPIPKVMRYQLADGATTVQFVRPAHGLIALHGDRVVDVSILGLQAGRITQGHRFQGQRDITLANAGEYETKLESEGGVIADFDRRKADIARQLADKAAALKASLGPEEGVAPLLDEVTALVEYPTVYVGEFETEFLRVPPECLILTMRQNQKYFPLFDGAGKLTNRFLIVSNMRLDDPRNIVEGNQRVVRPRLADARFFFETDKKVRLADRVLRLASIVYHNKLGSQLQRTERLQKLAGHIAAQLHASVAQAERAGYLSKADLVTGMVGEFPELQGIMGRYYALHDGEPDAVADAIEQHYRPRFANDTLPEGNIAAAAALADKLDTLVGIFGIRLAPTGDKDPFALRRHALGVLRILSEKQLPLDLFALLQQAKNLFPKDVLADSVAADVHGFMLDRLRSYLKDRGFAADEIESVVSQGPTRIDLVVPRLEAVRAFRRLPEAESLASANKRIRNILRKADTVAGGPDLALMQEAAEKKLFGAVNTLMPKVHSLVENESYADALRLLAGVRQDVDTFFDEVMVMSEDRLTRDNRLALLSQLERLMNEVADISKLAA